MKTIIMIIAVVMTFMFYGCGSDGGTSDRRIKNMVIDENNNGSADAMYVAEYGSDNYMSALIKYSCSTGPRLTAEDCSTLTLEHRYDFTRDGTAKIASMTKTYSDSSVDDYVFTYDGSGYLLSMTYDRDSNSTIDYNYYFTTNSDGDITRVEIDSDGDTLYDHYALITYFKAGKPYHYEYNQNNDGTIDYRKDFGYDASEKMISCAEDTDSDTDYDAYKVFNYSGDQMSYITSSPTNGGTPDHTDYLQYESGEEKGTELMWIYIKLGLFF